MRKKTYTILYLSFAVILFSSLIYLKNTKFKQQKHTNDQSSTNSISPTPTDQPLLDNKYHHAIIKTDKHSMLEVFSNLDEKLTSKKAKENHKCDALVSGGFYTKDDTHIGLFISRGEMLKDKISSNTFNGYLSISEQSDVTISKDPIKKSYFSFQTGPLLMLNKINQIINPSNQDGARRLIALISHSNQAHFVVIYNKNSPLKGPKLSELTNLLSAIEDLENLDIKDAINLDGGSHSAFLSTDATLTELSPIGSYICIKN